MRVNFMDTNVERWLPRAGGGRDVELLFKGCKVSVWEEEKVLKMDRAVGYTTVGMYLTLLNYTLKVKMGISLLVQWLRICHAIQGMQAQSLVQELRSHMPQSN